MWDGGARHRDATVVVFDIVVLVLRDIEIVDQTFNVKPKHWLLAIIAVSVLARVLTAFAMGDTVVPQPGIWDQVSYDRLAQRLVAGFGFSFAEASWPYARANEPTAFWSFLYTAYLAAHYLLFGHHALVPRLVQAVSAGILLPLGMYRLGRRTIGERVGLWAAGLSAVYLYFIYYSAALMTEIFTIVAVVWSLVLWLALAERPTWPRWLALGALIGLAALLRQVTLLVVPVLALWLLWRRREARTLAGLALAALVALVALLPVTLRNWRTYHRLVLVNTNSGFAFFWANHPIHGTDFQDILPDDGPAYQDLIPPELRHLDEAALNDALMARGWQFVRQDPARYFLLSASRLEDYFKFWPSAESSRMSNLARTLSFGLLLPLMLGGLYLSRERWRACLPLYLFAGTYVMIHLLSWALIRYRLPVDAVLLVFAGLACERLFAARLMARVRPHPAPVLPR